MSLMPLASGTLDRLRRISGTVAIHGLEQEELEAFILEKVRGGAPLPGIYPPGEKTPAEYEVWKRQRGKI
jgi:hypothetical protein